MPKCPVCLADETRHESVDEIFNINGRYVLVRDAPATVCVQCGERSFSRESVERMRAMIHGDSESSESVSIDVFRYAS